MDAKVDHYEDLGDGRVRVFTRIPTGEYASVVTGRDKLGTVDMYAMLQRAADQVSRAAAALAARRGRSDQDPT